MMLCETLEKADLPLFLSSVNKNEWTCNEKFDGDRIKMTINKGRAVLTNRRGVEVSEKYPEFEGTLSLPDCVLDGEMCVIDENGKSQFSEGIAFRTHNKNRERILQGAQDYPVTFVVFDILGLNGTDVTGWQLKDRITLLNELSLNHQNIIKAEYSSDILGMWKRVVEKDGEGIILKDLTSEYHYGKRKSDWRKVKDVKEQILYFHKFNKHNKGITIESKEGIRVTVNGFEQADEVMKDIQNNGIAIVEIRYLRKTKSGKFYQPTFFRRIENELLPK